MLSDNESTSIEMLRRQYKKAAKELLYSDWVQSALDEANTENAMSQIMTTARKENMNWTLDRK